MEHARYDTMHFVEIMYRWGKYEEDGVVNLGGKPYSIVYIMVHHESGCAWLVLKHGYDKDMWEYDIDYEQGLRKEVNHGSGETQIRQPSEDSGT